MPLMNVKRKNCAERKMVVNHWRFARNCDWSMRIANACTKMKYTEEEKKQTKNSNQAAEVKHASGHKQIYEEEEKSIWIHVNVLKMLCYYYSFTRHGECLFAAENKS